MGAVKLSDALRFSRERKAQHPMGEQPPLFATDYGIERYETHGTLTIPGLGSVQVAEPIVESWSQMEPEVRRLLLTSEDWEPIDPKPVMLVVAEAACDWSIHEKDIDPDDLPEEEEYYA